MTSTAMKQREKAIRAAVADFFKEIEEEEFITVPKYAIKDWKNRAIAHFEDDMDYYEDIEDLEHDVFDWIEDEFFTELENLSEEELDRYDIGMDEFDDEFEALCRAGYYGTDMMGYFDGLGEA